MGQAVFMGWVGFLDQVDFPGRHVLISFVATEAVAVEELLLVGSLRV